MSIEHRRDRRYSVELAAEIDVRGEVLMAATSNVSVGGVALVIDRQLPEGGVVALTLFLTQDGIEDPDEQPFEVRAKVQWATEQDAGGWIAGVRFEKVSDTQRAHLERFLGKLE